MTHTWDLYLSYQACAKCGRIFESRKDFEYVRNNYIKNLICPYCQESFTVEKLIESRPRGPLFGKPTKPEFDWS